MVMSLFKYELVHLLIFSSQVIMMKIKYDKKEDIIILIE